ncbi:hypothetical protein SAMN05444158_7340 [Bradyrhizobium canariense]|uniref:Uncharacterized protein n=2 Tax=Bradyrhizobium canariense TaxID=255045 RepID=A0A1H2BMH2_9BRAD|nr:hypothetical protein SAMN05444158_7340 [Bradyrhizobium canariense]
MKPIWKFRILALLVVVFVGGLSITNLVANFLQPDPSPLPSRDSKAPSAQLVSSAKLVSTIAPFRTDLKADYAIALAGQTLRSESSTQTPDNDTAQDAVKSALKSGPHDSRMWLVLALLQARKNLGAPLVAESLKMSYLTGPNRAELIPVRLDSVTVSNALNDGDLNELARSDVRAILTQYPDQRRALISDYVRGSAIGKKFLEESSRMLDPAFADSLRNAK